MKASQSFQAIFLYKPFVDMRKSFNGLCQIIESEFGLNPCDGGLFVFVSRDRSIIKAIYWDESGFAIWHKRLEKEKYTWLRRHEGPYLAISSSQLDWLLAGLDIEESKPHEKLNFASFS